MKATPSSLRAAQVSTGDETRWKTSSGGFFVEPVQRAVPGSDIVTLTVHMPYKTYRLLEVLQDDVSAYIARLLESHVKGLVKSSKINAERNRT